jgi:hypothetical protein
MQFSLVSCYIFPLRSKYFPQLPVLKHSQSMISLNMRVSFTLYKTTGIFTRTGSGSTQPPTQWVPGVLSLGVKRLESEDDHSPPSSAEVKDAWSYTCTPQYAFMVWCSVKAQGQLYLYIYPSVHLQRKGKPRKDSSHNTETGPSLKLGTSVIEVRTLPLHQPAKL